MYTHSIKNSLTERDVDGLWLRTHYWEKYNFGAKESIRGRDRELHNIEIDHSYSSMPLNHGEWIAW
jgi:hypothetical protein